MIQAYAEGKGLECRYKAAPEEGWANSDNPCFDFSMWEYRVKPEPKYRPFKNVEAPAVRVVKASHGYFAITGIKKCGIYYGVANNFHGYEYLFTDYLFADGTPFGIEEDGTA